MQQPTPSTPKSSFLPTPAMLWQLMQTIWLGSHIAALLLFIPLLNKIGFAPILVQEVQNQLRPALLVMTIMASAVQMLVLVRVEGMSALIRQLRGQLLLAAWLLALLTLLGFGKGLFNADILRAMYGAMLGCGLVLLAQQLPGKPN